MLIEVVVALESLFSVWNFKEIPDFQRIFESAVSIYDLVLDVGCIEFL